MATREWKDGLLSKVMRDLGEIPDEKPKWIILDGDLDANWIESMNSVMDDNKMLTLASNERIPLKPHMRLIFEIRDLRFATPATVSRALSDHHEISDSTKKKVKAVADRLDYRPNKIASSLRSGKTKIIGVLIPTAEHLFFGSVIHGISNLASQHGYDVLIYQSNESEEFEKFQRDFVFRMNNLGFKSFILFHNGGTRTLTFWKE